MPAHSLPSKNAHPYYASMGAKATKNRRRAGWETPPGEAAHATSPPPLTPPSTQLRENPDIGLRNIGGNESYEGYGGYVTPVSPTWPAAPRKGGRRGGWPSSVAPRNQAGDCPSPADATARPGPTRRHRKPRAARPRAATPLRPRTQRRQSPNSRPVAAPNPNSSNPPISNWKLMPTLNRNLMPTLTQASPRNLMPLFTQTSPNKIPPFGT